MLSAIQIHRSKVADRWLHSTLTGAIFASLCMHAVIVIYLLNYGPAPTPVPPPPVIELRLLRSTPKAQRSVSAAEGAFAATLRPIPKPALATRPFGAPVPQAPRSLGAPLDSDQPAKAVVDGGSASAGPYPAPANSGGSRAALRESLGCDHIEFLGLDAAARERCATQFATRGESARILTVTPLNPGTAAALQKTAADNEKWRKYYASKNMDDYPGLMSFLSH